MPRRLIWALVFLLLALALLLLYRLPAGFADAVADAVSRPVGTWLSDRSARLPFPLGEALTIALALGFAVGLARAVLLSAAKRSARPLSGFCRNLALLISAVLLSYSALWAPLYYARPLSARLGIETDERYTLSELIVLCRELTDTANRLRESAPGALPPYPQDTLIERAGAALSSIERLPLDTNPIKPARYPELFRAIGIAGVYFPWTGESIVSAGGLTLSLPFIYTHEAAHQAGFAREDEANYIAYLACAQGDEYFQYSGAMYALYYAMEALHDADTISWTRQRMQMSEAVQGDYYRMNGLRNAGEPTFSWLRGTAVAVMRQIGGQAGAHNYGDMVNLLIDERRAKG